MPRRKVKTLSRILTSIICIAWFLWSVVPHLFGRLIDWIILRVVQCALCIAQSVISVTSQARPVTHLSHFSQTTTPQSKRKVSERGHCVCWLFLHHASHCIRERKKLQFEKSADDIPYPPLVKWWFPRRKLDEALQHGTQWTPLLLSTQKPFYPHDLGRISRTSSHFSTHYCAGFWITSSNQRITINFIIKNGREIIHHGFGLYESCHESFHDIPNGRPGLHTGSPYRYYRGVYSALWSAVSACVRPIVDDFLLSPSETVTSVRLFVSLPALVGSTDHALLVLLQKCAISQCKGGKLALRRSYARDDLRMLICQSINQSINQLLVSSKQPINHRTQSNPIHKSIDCSVLISQ